MKKLLFVLLMYGLVITAAGQPLPVHVSSKYNAAKTGKEKGACLLPYFLQQLRITPGFKKDILLLKTWFGNQKDETGTNYTNLGLAMALAKTGDYPASLDILFSTLHEFEKQKDSFGILNSYNLISGTYLSAKDFTQAAAYSKKEIDYISAEHEKELLSQTYNGIACIYGEGKMGDSGMLYAEKAVKMDTELKNFTQLAVSTSTLGENYIAAGQYDLALPFIRRTAAFYHANGASSPYMDAYLKNDFAEIFLNTGHLDSATYYAREALLLSVPFDVKDQSMRAYEYLYKSYEKLNRQDSLNKYFRLSMLTKDSLISLEKVKSMQALTFHEEIHQQEMIAEKQKLSEERHQNLEYAVIALGIIIFVTVFLILSRTLIVNEKLISFFAVLGLLVVFEFINLLIHPWLAHFTHESPLLMLLALVAIAALLIPLHHKMEHFIKEKLVEKNKAIRLAEAKKIIAQLEQTKETA